MGPAIRARALFGALEGQTEMAPPTGTKSDRSALSTTLMVLTFTTGLIDAVSFIGLGHVFTANMTGNVVFIAFALAGVSGLSALRSSVSLVAFMVGAAVGGRLAVAMKEATHRRWLSTAAGIEATLLLAAAGCGFGYDHVAETPVWSLYALIVLTALAMGFRNATVIRIRDPDLKTTVLTLTITGIAADSSFAGGTNPRVGRRALSVLLLFAGAGLGAFLLLRYGAPPPVFVTAVLVVAATVLYVRDPASQAVVEQAKKTPSG